MESSLAYDREQNYGGPVLNALRHQWNPHINAMVNTYRSMRAQRLAASMESSHLGIGEEHKPVMCSTPCGINGILTCLCLLNSPTQLRCSTPCGINGILTRVQA